MENTASRRDAGGPFTDPPPPQLVIGAPAPEGAAHGSNGEQIDRLQVVSLFLSVYVLAALIAETLFKISGPTLDMLDKFDSVICLFFLFDFAVRFQGAESKLAFMKWGWIDLISSIPFWGVFQWTRIARIFRILRAVRSARVFLRILYPNRAQGTLLTAVCIAVLTVILSSVAVLNFETDPASNIKTPEDAIWWAVSTLSTVGYGDKYPVTLEGRVTAVLLMTCGIGLIGIYTASVASFFLAEDQKHEDKDMKLLAEEVRLLRQKIEEWEAFALRKHTEPQRDASSERPAV